MNKLDIPDISLPIITESNEFNMSPKKISFGAYLCLVASNWANMSKEERSRKYRTENHPVPVTFKWLD